MKVIFSKAEELFLYQGSFKPSLLQLIFYIVQSTMLVPCAHHYVQPTEVFEDERPKFLLFQLNLRQEERLSSLSLLLSSSPFSPPFSSYLPFPFFYNSHIAFTLVTVHCFLFSCAKREQISRIDDNLYFAVIPLSFLFRFLVNIIR